MSTAYSTKGLDHLGLVAGMCQKLGVVKFFDHAHPNQSEHRHIFCGQLVVSMLLNGLGLVGRTLHMYPEYFAERPVERLIGKGIKAEYINDDHWEVASINSMKQACQNSIRDYRSKLLLRIKLIC